MYIEATRSSTEKLIIFDFENTGASKAAIKDALKGFEFYDIIDEYINILLSPSVSARPRIIGKDIKIPMISLRNWL